MAESGCRGRISDDGGVVEARREMVSLTPADPDLMLFFASEGSPIPTTVLFFVCYFFSQFFPSAARMT